MNKENAVKREEPAASQSMTVSVVIPALNAEDTLVPCLNSLRQQTRRPLQVIVVDDGSTDETYQVIESFEEVRGIRRPNQGGAGAARADGVKIARGEIIAFLDSDCIPPADWIERIIESLSQNASLGAVGGPYHHTEISSLASLAYASEQDYSWYNLSFMPDQATMPGGNMAVRRSHWEEAQSGCEVLFFPNKASGEDSVIAAEIKSHSATRFIPELSVKHTPKESLGEYLAMHINRGYSRMIIILNGLVDEDDGAVSSNGGLPLFLGSIALPLAIFFAVLSVALALAMPETWPWLLGLAGITLAGHLIGCKKYLDFVRNNPSSKAESQPGFLRIQGIRLLLGGRAICWSLGALKAVWEKTLFQVKLMAGVAASILHFWMPGRISKLFYFVTSQCNARCDFCFNLDNVIDWKKRVKSELSLGEIEKIAENFGRLPYLTFSGGEPFARVDLPEICEAFHKKAKTQWMCIPTNGALTRAVIDSVIEILRRCPALFLTVQFSLDTLYEEHDESRKIKGGFEGLVRTAKKLALLKKRCPRLRIQISTPYDAFNRDRIPEIIDFCRRELEFDQHHFNMLREARVLVTQQNRELVDEYLHFLMEHEKKEWADKGRSIWARAVRALTNVTYTDFRKVKLENAFIRKCFATRKFVTLYDDGTFTPCEVLEEEELGNIREFEYDYYLLRKRNGVDAYHRREIVDKQCRCEWPCQASINILYDPGSWPRILRGVMDPPSVMPKVPEPSKVKPVTEGT